MPSASTTRLRSRLRSGAIGGAIGLLLLTLGAGCDTDGSRDPAATARKELADASPLAEFLDIPPRNQRRLPHLDDQERLRQDNLTELVAQCMAGAGFEYVPVPIAHRLGDSLLEAYALDPMEFAQRYGYGATTIEAEEYDDPNQQIRDELAPGQQAEYDRALWGDPTSAGGGCYLQASAEVYGDPAARETGYAEFEKLTAQINELYERIDTDPRLREAHEQWAACLADAGYPDFAEPLDARQSVFDRIPDAAASPALPDEPDPGAVDPDALDPDRLAEVREYELALAPIDQDCQRRHVAGPRREVTIAQERAFIDEHATELVRYRDWLATPD